MLNRRRKPVITADGVSDTQAMENSVTNMIGDRKKSVAKGFEVAGCRRRRIWVSAHRKPEKNDADRAKAKPRAWNAVSPATIIKTPKVIVRMIRMSLMEGFSRRKRKANIRTKIRTEDLHMV